MFEAEQPHGRRSGGAARMAALPFHVFGLHSPDGAAYYVDTLDLLYLNDASPSVMQHEMSHRLYSRLTSEVEAFRFIHLLDGHIYGLLASVTQYGGALSALWTAREEYTLARRGSPSVLSSRKLLDFMTSGWSAWALPDSVKTKLIGLLFLENLYDQIRVELDFLAELAALEFSGSVDIDRLDWRPLPQGDTTDIAPLSGTPRELFTRVLDDHTHARERIGVAGYLGGDTDKETAFWSVWTRFKAVPEAEVRYWLLRYCMIELLASTEEEGETVRWGTRTALSVLDVNVRYALQSEHATRQWFQRATMRSWRTVDAGLRSFLQGIIGGESEWHYYRLLRGALAGRLLHPYTSFSHHTAPTLSGVVSADKPLVLLDGQVRSALINPGLIELGALAGLDAHWWRRLFLLTFIRQSYKHLGPLVCPLKGWVVSAAKPLADGAATELPCDSDCPIKKWLTWLGDWSDKSVTVC